MSNFRSCRAEGLAQAARRPRERPRGDHARLPSPKDQLGGKSARASNDRENAGAGCTGRVGGGGECSDPTHPSANPIPLGRGYEAEERSSAEMVAPDECGLPEARRRRRSPVGPKRRAPGDWAWRAGAHGADAQPPGGAGRRSLTRPLPRPQPRRSPEPSSRSPGCQGWFANTHALRWRMSRQSRLPPGVLGDALHQGLPRGHAGKTKGQSDRCSRAEISTGSAPQHGKSEKRS